MGTIICIGGLVGLKNKEKVFIPYSPRKIDFEIMKLSTKVNPKVLFIGTASSEREDYYISFKNAYESLGAIVENLCVLNSNITFEEIRKKILSSDIIYVGCGKTKFMMDVWKSKGIDKCLIEAYKKDIILAGMSAGSYCWFKYNYEMIEGLDLIHMINCVHYDEKSKEKKKQFYDNIKKNNLRGIAIDNDASLIFSGTDYKIVKNYENSKAYDIVFEDGKYIEKEII